MLYQLLFFVGTYNYLKKNYQNSQVRSATITYKLLIDITIF